MDASLQFYWYEIKPDEQLGPRGGLKSSEPHTDFGSFVTS